MVLGVSVFGHVFPRALKTRIGALFRPLGSRGPLLRPRCKTHHYVVIGVRSGALLGQNGPGTREGCTFSKGLFLVVFRESTLYVVFCVPLGARGLFGRRCLCSRGLRRSLPLLLLLQPKPGRAGNGKRVWFGVLCQHLRAFALVSQKPMRGRTGAGTRTNSPYASLMRPKRL